MHDVTQAHLQNSGDSQKNIDCRHLVPAFDLADINWIEVNPLSQCLLRQTLQFAVFPNAVAEEFSIFLRDHVRGIKPNSTRSSRTDANSYHLDVAPGTRSS